MKHCDTLATKIYGESKKIIKNKNVIISKYSLARIETGSTEYKDSVLTNIIAVLDDKTSLIAILIKVRVFYPECRCHNRFYHLYLFFFIRMVFQGGSVLEIKLNFSKFRPMDTNTFHAILHAQIELFGDQRYAKNIHENTLLLLLVNKRCFLSRLHSVCVSLPSICIHLFHK